jgi:AraC family transcriptional regulator
MPQLVAIAQALDFVERHLKHDIGVADMAGAAGYSLYHFCRVFNGLVHHTPYDYLIRRRLSQSAQSLLETDWRVVDIAFDYQFNSHETYSRAFKRMFGVPPHRYRTLHANGRPAPDRRTWMPRLTVEYLRHINRGDDLRPVLTEREPLQLTGLVSLVKDGSVIAHLWEMLAHELSQLESVDPPPEHYGIALYPADWQRDGFFYLAAIDVRSLQPPRAAEGNAQPLPPVLVAKTLPPLRCARFVHRGPRSRLHLTLSYICHTWLPQSDVRQSLPLEIEYHGRNPTNQDHDDSQWEILIPIE